MLQWISSRWRQTVHSIAFLPGVIAFLFLLLSVLMVFFDESVAGKAIKANWHMLRLRDASTARTIISAISAGIISLTVFSFSMVMIVLNQAASQMSNRVLDKLIGNRFQQLILGFYIGTIVYSLFLLSTIRDVDQGIYVPSLSTYLLIVMTVLDIFLFIYFLHYITQSVKYEIIIDRIHDHTKQSLKQTCRLDIEADEIKGEAGYTLAAPESGILTGFDREGLLKLMEKTDLRLSFLFPLGTFLLQGTPFLSFSSDNGEEIMKWKDKIFLHITIAREESVDDDYNYGLRQLMEVAIKALSPGVNDPGTAVASLRALINLLAYRLKHYPSNVIRDEKGTIRIITKELRFDQLFDEVIQPIWDYGKNDRLLRNEMRVMLAQLLRIRHHPAISRQLARVQRKIDDDNN